MSSSLFSLQGFLKGYQRYKLSSKLYMGFSPEKVFLIIVYNEAIINMWYNFLLLFPSDFKDFLVTYTPVFFLVFILQEFLEEQYHSLISRTNSISQQVISTDFSDTPSVISPRPRRLCTWGSPPREACVSNGMFPHYHGRASWLRDGRVFSP
jgi:hypothetical protein